MTPKEHLIASLKALCEREGGYVAVADEIKANDQSIWQIINGVKLPSGEPRGVGPSLQKKLSERYPGWDDLARQRVASGTSSAIDHRKGAEEPAPDDVVIHQYVNVGGGMNTNGRLLLESAPPGEIKSWRVTPEWLRLNVPAHTGLKNLAIVTGFGPSMKPMFNPGDPLLVDTGVKVIDHEGVYFFRVGDEGFIKLIQRVPNPEGAGVMLNIISKNPDYPPYPMSPKNPHFKVIGKVLTVWRSEHF